MHDPRHIAQTHLHLRSFFGDYAFLLVKDKITTKIDKVTGKLICGNQNQDNKYVAQTIMHHRCEF